MFSATSRYAGLPVAEHKLPDGRIARYVTRRLLPDPNTLTTLRFREVQAGERLDHVAATELGDPEQAWRITDAHRVLDPARLTTPPKQRLRIPVPAGLPVGASMVGGGGG